MRVLACMYVCICVCLQFSLLFQIPFIKKIDLHTHAHLYYYQFISAFKQFQIIGTKAKNIAVAISFIHRSILYDSIIADNTTTSL